MSTDVHRLGGYGIPAIPTLPNSVYSVNSVGEQRTPTICVHPCHPWEKRYSRRTHGTHGTFWQRRASHRCSQIRMVWHPCHTHAAKFCVFCEFCGRTAYHNNLCSSVPSVGALSLQEGSVRSVHSVGGVAVVWCSRDCCTPGLAAWVWQGCHTLLHLCPSVPFVGGSLSNRLPCLRRVLWKVNAHQISSEKLCANPVTCNANIVQAPST